MKSKYDAILLLGLKLNADGTPKHELTLRIETAAACYQEGLAPLVIPCGGQTEGTPISEAAVMRDALMARGVPEKAIHLEDRSLITVENLLNARDMLGKKHPRVLIVTSDYHMLRAKLICRFSAHMRPGGRKARIPREETVQQRRMEPLHALDYMLGYQTGKYQRPRWYRRLMYEKFGIENKKVTHANHGK